jgi:hypothetical protein
MTRYNMISASRPFCRAYTVPIIISAGDGLTFVRSMESKFFTRGANVNFQSWAVPFAPNTLVSASMPLQLSRL